MENFNLIDSLPDKRKLNYESTNYTSEKHVKQDTEIHDGRKCISRVLVKKTEFAKIIGKGGVTVNQIKTKCGASVRGVEIDDENRIFTIGGSMKQVLDCFELISDIMNNISIQSPIYGNSLTVHLLVEHAKAGKIVGAKGGNIQILKARSGCSNIRIIKDPAMISGVQLRVIILDGTLADIRRAHFMILDILFPDDLHNQNVIPLASLIDHGVSQNVIDKTIELSSMLQPHGLKLVALPITDSNGASKSEESGNQLQDADNSPDENKIEFYIPKDSAGLIIGKGGSNIKDMMLSHSVKVVIDREEYQNMRKVTIKGDDINKINETKDKILFLSKVAIDSATINNMNVSDVNNRA